MITTKLYVTDTNGVIRFFHQVFDSPDRLSTNTYRIMEQAFKSYVTDVRLSIPSVVLVEIFEKWFESEVFAKKFFYEVYLKIENSPNIEIKPIDREVMEVLLQIRGNLDSHDLHDKIILASAMMLECPLITTDTKIINYLSQNQLVSTIN